MQKSEKIELIEIVRNDILNLKKSELVDFRKENNYFPVIGQGDLNAKIIFVGEAPGKKEAETGVPFCGRSGKFLDEMLLSIKLSRENVYITNLVNDRPPENRDPSEKEIELYGKFLERQIEIIKPKVIIALGRLPMKYIFEKYGIGNELKVISQIHGQIFKTKKFSILPLFHPAVALYSGSKRELLIKDFSIVKKFL